MGYKTEIHNISPLTLTVVILSYQLSPAGGQGALKNLSKTSPKRLQTFPKSTENQPKCYIDYEKCCNYFMCCFTC